MNPARMTSALICVLWGMLCAGQSAQADDVTSVQPLVNAHAHNDYLHLRPLLDALDNGFCSVEADIFLVDGKLLVAHSRVELRPDRTLQSLYLDPLRERVAANGGRVYRDGPIFTLLIDIKASGGEAFAVLNRMLAEYPEVFSHFEEGQFHEQAVTVVVSGDRPQAAIAAAAPRYAAIDGRLSDLQSELPAHLMPLISDNWRSHFRWRGNGPMPMDERDKLQHIIQTAHAKKRRVRFWASPDNPAVWAELRDAGADLINTDDLPGLRKFLTAERQ
jgi:hypothetical protein